MTEKAEEKQGPEAPHDAWGGRQAALKDLAFLNTKFPRGYWGWGVPSWHSASQAAPGLQFLPVLPGEIGADPGVVRVHFHCQLD